MMYLPTYHNLYINKDFFFLNSVYYDYYLQSLQNVLSANMMSNDILLNYLQIPTGILTLIKIHSAA